MQQSKELKGVAFAEVIEGATGHQVIPVDPQADAELLEKINAAVERALRSLNEEKSPIREMARINEASAPIEAALIRELNKEAGWQASIPVNAEGTEQRSGYPDIRLHTPDFGIIYLDPKLFAAGSEKSSFRTFYYEPKTETNKVRDDAKHILIGIAHNGETGEKLRLLNWHLVDVARLRVQLKAEFQASNRDLYQESTTLTQKTLN